MTPKLTEYYNSKFVAQDVLVPASKTGECMELMHDLFGIYPLWLCAHKVVRTRMGTMLDVEPDYDSRASHQQGDTSEAQMYVDVGVWSTPAPILRGEEFDLTSAVDEMEAWLIANHGYQALYAITQLSEKDFWRMFDKTLYSAVRRKYGAENSFFDVYHKVGPRPS
jgi:delta24-sterol reductase